MTRFAHSVFLALERFSRRRFLVCLLFAVGSMGLRLALIHSHPIPTPFVADEFSYLLGAETFKSGRITNPQHALWDHFETLHEIVRPSYTTMYPPGQSLFLAAGWKLFGHPWYGVLIAFGILAGCLCWMLQQWTAPVYAMLATTVLLARISIFGYWMNSYWGGTVAAIGGCLLFGTLPRLAREVKIRDGVIAGIGLAIWPIPDRSRDSS